MIRLTNINKQYDLGDTQVSALKDVSLTIDRGEYIAIMGPSGSGKSTLMHILGILDSITSGQYFLEDYDISSLPDREQARIRNQHFGFIFQSFNLFPELSALENVMLPMGYAGVPWLQRKTRAQDLLAEVGLDHRMNHLPTMMSGGEQQRVAIARSLSNDPDLILADEPTGNLPTDKGEEIMQILEGFNKKGVTIVMVTHNPSQGERAGRVISLKDGVLQGEPVREEVRA
ncbi:MULTISPECIES: ABC transporter ATP-binding protein [unclassified Oceanispirochaeta]|uniref:ABC transporter ATP-binding protein n=1 Tax=unclassified Oceanispirochaeta TaxID=2635722 RepID=UPI000E099A82|nr:MULTISPECIES: ABC transporter ATP-binding protein [unclassified Oceanispirochaeta]MBF9018173.1 ABC transporter ATP-binding protein [Oceanispirochaeta sp. M2]NPD74644.1 ABC transporter ATP-binding protein [Oceanispirochaeta sp. M1]RDG29514.1 ABC transporter ATP-binding protein [Oceanispirochaeta sp. M1]